MFNVGRGGFEPPKSKDNRFTVCPSWPLWYLPENQNIKELPCNKDSNYPLDFKGMQNYTVFSIIQIITTNCIFFFRQLHFLSKVAR